jgi:holliday junction DNA helicase RuvA
MIAYLSGKIINKSQNYAIIDVNGVGYKVFTNTKLLAELKIGASPEIYIHQHIREDASDLYGFKSLEELELFELLLSVSGVGPKSASAVLGVATPEDIRTAIVSGDSSLLTKVSGIGKKTAERVVLELRTKINNLAFGAAGLASGVASGLGGDEIDALMALGYSLAQAREALNKVDAGVKDSGERIREALRRLG